MLGHPCRYDQKSKPCEAVISLSKRDGIELIAICPEELGGLPTPREPSEISGDRVISQSGKDVTRQFEDGAAKTLRIAKEHSCIYAVLKARSPSCSPCGVYDGSFSGKVIDGMGITARLLTENGIKILSEEEI
jgi:uncharacterized protein YbbK (DUF523 family)